MAESRETILGIIQEIKDATEPNSVTNRMVAAVFDFFASELVTEQTVQQFLNQLNSKQDVIQDLATIRSGAEAGATAAQPAALNEVLLRAQGRSENYEGRTDPIKYKLFGGDDYPSDSSRQNAIIYDINMWLDAQHYGNGATEAKAKSVPQGLIHIDQDGSCLWFINSPLSFATDTWLQIVFNGTVYEDTINGVTRQYIRVSEGQDTRMWQRTCRNGEWNPWGQVTVSPSDLQSIIDTLSGKYTKPNGGIPASDLASAVQQSLSKADTALQSHQNLSGKATVIDLSLYVNSRIPTPEYQLTDNYMPYYTWGEYPILQWGVIVETDEESNNDFYYVGRFSPNGGMTFEYLAFSNKGDWGLLGGTTGIFTEENVPDVVLATLNLNTASSNAKGLMSAADKTKLDGMFANAHTWAGRQDFSQRVGIDEGYQMMTGESDTVNSNIGTSENIVIKEAYEDPRERDGYRDTATLHSNYLRFETEQDNGNTHSARFGADTGLVLDEVQLSATDISHLKTMWQYGVAKGWWS